MGAFRNVKNKIFRLIEKATDWAPWVYSTLQISRLVRGDLAEAKWTVLYNVRGSQIPKEGSMKDRGPANHRDACGVGSGSKPERLSKGPINTGIGERGRSLGFAEVDSSSRRSETASL